MIETAQIEEHLIEALHAKRFRTGLAELTMTDGLSAEQTRHLNEIITRLDEFDRATVAAAAEVQSYLSLRHPAPTLSLDPERVDGRLTLSVAVDAIDGVIAELEGAGYTHMFQLSPGGREALRRTGRSIELVAPGGPITAIKLQWGAPTGVSVLPRRLRPGFGDLQFVSLPAWAWWAYWGVKPIRRLGRILGLGRASRSAGPYLGTPVGLVASMFDPGDLTKEDTLIDLGCGDGRVLVAVVSRFGCRARGIEIDARLAALAKRNVAQAGLADRVSIEVADLEAVELRDAKIVFAFLPVGYLATILDKILKRMSPGARLIAHEQERVSFVPAPDRRRLLVDQTGVTVAHIWTA